MDNYEEALRCAEMRERASEELEETLRPDSICGLHI